MEEEKNGPGKADKSLNGEPSSLRSPPAIDHSYQLFIEKMAEAALVLSKEGKILYCNPSFLQLIESSEPIIGTSFLDLVQAAERKYIIEFLHQKKINETELSFITKKQNTLRASVSASEILWNESEERYLLLLDLTKSKNTQDLIEATEALARILSANIPLKTASQFILDVFNRYFSWEVMVIWIWNHEKNKLQCAQISHIPEINLDSFEKTTRGESHENLLLVDRVATSLRPLWIEDVSEDPNYIRRKEAIESGLRGAFIFPFLNEVSLGGVIELYRRAPYKIHMAGDTLDTFTSIGIMFGLYIQRIISEETKHQLAGILDHSINNIYKVDLHGIITEWNFCAENSYGWRASEIIGKRIDILYPHMKSVQFDEILNDLLTEKSIEKFQSERVRKNGELF